MNIYAGRGSKVVYLDENGYDSDRKWARECGLVKGQIYTVFGIDVHSSSSSVLLEEIGEHHKYFNTVMFQDLDEYLEENRENEYQEAVLNVPVIPETKFGDFRASAQGKIDFNVEVVNLNDAMAVCTKDGVVYITCEQAKAFFDLAEKHPVNILLEAKNSDKKFEWLAEIPTKFYSPSCPEGVLKYVPQWLSWDGKYFFDDIERMCKIVRIKE